VPQSLDGPNEIGPLQKGRWHPHLFPPPSRGRSALWAMTSIAPTRPPQGAAARQECRAHRGRGSRSFALLRMTEGAGLPRQGGGKDVGADSQWLGPDFVGTAMAAFRPSHRPATGPIRLGPYRRPEAGISKPALPEAVGRPEAGAPLCGARQVANLPHQGAAEDGRALRLRSLRSAQDRQGRRGAAPTRPLAGPRRDKPPSPRLRSPGNVPPTADVSRRRAMRRRSPPPYSSPVKGEGRM